ncbi:MAG: hypothetical protein OXI01_05900 [Albidovulum sp.]|nr:hypothetical protein [Albidovulum sp.]
MFKELFTDGPAIERYRTAPLLNVRRAGRPACELMEDACDSTEFKEFNRLSVPALGTEGGRWPLGWWRRVPPSTSTTSMSVTVSAPPSTS